jgi:hypothetical protein
MPTGTRETNAFDQAAARWRQLQRDHWHLLRGGPQPPEPLDGQQLRQLVATLLHPRHRPLLRKALIDLLSGDGRAGEKGTTP